MVMIRNDKDQPKLTKVEEEKLKEEMIARSKNLIKRIDEAYKRSGNSTMIFK